LLRTLGALTNLLEDVKLRGANWNWSNWGQACDSAIRNFPKRFHKPPTLFGFMDANIISVCAKVFAFRDQRRVMQNPFGEVH